MRSKLIYIPDRIEKLSVIAVKSKGKQEKAGEK